MFYFSQENGNLLPQPISSFRAFRHSSSCHGSKPVTVVQRLAEWLGLMIFKGGRVAKIALYLKQLSRQFKSFRSCLTLSKFFFFFKYIVYIRTSDNNDNSWKIFLGGLGVSFIFSRILPFMEATQPVEPMSSFGSKCETRNVGEIQPRRLRRTSLPGLNSQLPVDNLGFRS